MQVSELELRLTATDLEPLLQQFWPATAPVRAGKVQVDGDAVLIDLAARRLGMTLATTLTARISEVTPDGVAVDLSIPRLAALPKAVQGWLLGYVGRQIPVAIGAVAGNVLRLNWPALLQYVPFTGQLVAAAIANGVVWVRVSNVRYDLNRGAEADDYWAQHVQLEPVETAPGDSGRGKWGPTQEGEPGQALVPAADAAAGGEQDSSGYAALRRRLEGFLNGRLPDALQPAAPWLLALPDLFVLLVRLTRDARVPPRSKLVAAAAAAYILMPLDILPDWIPGAGLVDDLALALLALESLLAYTPPETLAEHWPGRGDVLRAMREGLDFVADYLPSPLMIRLRRWLRSHGGGGGQ